MGCVWERSTLEETVGDVEIFCWERSKFHLADPEKLNQLLGISFIVGHKLLRVHCKIHKCLDLLGWRKSGKECEKANPRAYMANPMILFSRGCPSSAKKNEEDFARSSSDLPTLDLLQLPQLSVEHSSSVDQCTVFDFFLHGRSKHRRSWCDERRFEGFDTFLLRKHRDLPLPWSQCL